MRADDEAHDVASRLARKQEARLLVSIAHNISLDYKLQLMVNPQQDVQ